MSRSIVTRGILKGVRKTESLGGGSSNTHLSERQNGLITGGEDTVRVSFGVQWRDNGIELLRELADAKALAQQAHEMVCVQLGTIMAGVCPSGGGGGFPYYHYRVERSGYVFFIQDVFEPQGAIANVRVEVGSLILMANGGLVGIWPELEGIIHGMGGVIVFDKLSRIDICADLPGVRVDEFANLVLAKQYVCQTTQLTYHQNGEPWTGVQFGNDEVVLRIYDKVAELKRKPDFEKTRVLEELRWGCPQTHAVRVEFQIRRDALRCLGISCLADYVSLRAELANYLCQQWFRLLDSVPDRDNHNVSRAETHPLWVAVMDAIADWTGRTPDTLRRSVRRTRCNVIRLLDQALGCLLHTAAYVSNGQSLDSGELVEFMCESIVERTKRLGDKELQQRYQSKATRIFVAEEPAL